MKKVILLISAIAISVMATDIHNAAYAQKKSKAKVTCGPYVQCVSETGFTVMWTTDVDAVAWVEVAPDDGTHFYNKERDKYYDNRGNGVLPIGKIHKIEVDGLEPGTRYRYRLMSKGVIEYNGGGDVEYMRTTGTDVYKGQPYVISTFRKDYENLRFDMYNDIHGRDSILNVLLENSKKDADFVFTNGDMTTNIADHNMIADMYLRTIAKNLNGSVPLFASRGNHELRGKDAIRWLDYFQTPTGTPYYSFRIGKFFFVVLDACEDKPDSDIEYSGIVASQQYLRRQEKWLREVLGSEECRNAEVRIAFCHVNPEEKGWYGMAQLCERLVPALNDANIDAMFCGHIHKWRVVEPDGSICNAKFPIICNPNVQRMEVSATTEEIKIRTVNSDGTETNSYVIDLK